MGAAMADEKSTCAAIRYVWPPIGSTTPCATCGDEVSRCVTMAYQSGFEMARSLEAIEPERRDRYRRCLRSLLDNVPTGAPGCACNMLRGLLDGLNDS